MTVARGLILFPSRLVTGVIDLIGRPVKLGMVRIKLFRAR